MSSLATQLPSRTSRRIPWAVALGFVAVFLLLDWVSYIRPLQGLNITPWNPQPALAIALLLWNRRWLWLVWLSLLVAEFVVRGVPDEWLVALTATAALALTHAAIAQALSLRLDRSLALARRRDLLWFTGIVLVGALLSGIVYVAAYSAAGLAARGVLVGAVARYWVGDAVGIVVMLPMLLMMMDPQRRDALVRTLKSRDGWLIAALIIVLVAAVFGRDDHDQFKFFYLLLLPVVWAAARKGVPGAVLAAGLTQVALIIAVQSSGHQDLTVFEFQVLIAAVTMTGLLLGVAVDEQARAETELRGSLRLAAAGQMASALAHELSQPLTAISSYAQACRTLAAPGDDFDQARRDKLVEVAQRMVDDAHRASDVVKRLRDFFRSGTTQLRPVEPGTLLAEAVDGQMRRAQALQVDLQLRMEAPLPEVWMDPIQIGVVLRNLLANALDAASAAGAPGTVIVAAAADARSVRIEVRDSGDGVDVLRLQGLFEPGSSDKPGGMGIGLSISRAIIEAHGGRLWAEAGPGGKFCFTLPLESHEADGASHAA